MPQPKLSRAKAEAAVRAVEISGGVGQAARDLGIADGTLQGRLRAAERYYGLVPSMIAAAPTPPAAIAAPVDADKLRAHLQRHPATLAELAIAFNITQGAVLDACHQLRAQGYSLFESNGTYSIERQPLPMEPSEDLHRFDSNADGYYRFGFTTDNHLCSKYSRLDVLNDLYDWFAEEGVSRVYNAGNWIDGEATFNKFDLMVHGMTPQVRYFVENYPHRPGIVTHYIAGDDHEGWYAQKHGIDIGRYAQQVAQDAGRTDLAYLGYMEAFITLRHLPTGSASRMLVQHPGGGSAYALSYAPQKTVESFEGGEKPAVLLIGHYHKLEFHNDRNVWVIQGGTTEDQTPFMRKRKIQAHVGGWIVELWQDAKGAIVQCRPTCRRYFDRGYYNGNFNMAGPIRQAK